MRPFLDDTAQIIGTKFEFDQAPQGRSDREKKISEFVLAKAKTVYENAEKLGGVKFLPRFDAYLMHVIYMKKYSKKQEGDNAVTDEDLADRAKASVLTASELELAEKLVEAGNSLVEANLVQGTWGNLSIRVDSEYMLVTPSGIDYERLKPSDMVKVKISDGTYEGSIKPTSERNLHAAVYASRPEVGAVIHTHSTYCSAFAAAEKTLPVEVNEDQATFSTEIRLASYGLPGTKKLKENTIAALGDNNACIMSHHGMIVCGEDMTTAYANAIRVEKLAEGYLSSR